MTKEIFLPKWAQTGEKYGDSLTELVLSILTDHQVEFTPTCADSPCLPSPNETLRQGITTLLALVQALDARVDALENP